MKLKYTILLLLFSFNSFGQDLLTVWRNAVNASFNNATLISPVTHTLEGNTLQSLSYIIDTSFVHKYSDSIGINGVFLPIGVKPNFTVSGGGSVTAFSAGNLNPLFTTTVSTSTTTPALFFSLSNIGPNLLFGNNTASTAPPNYFHPALTSAMFGSIGTTTTVLHGNASGNLTFGSVALTTDVSGALPVANGGTGISTYATGDLLYASATNTLSKLTAGTNTYVLTLAGGVPTWAAPSGGGSTPVVQMVTGTGTISGTTTLYIINPAHLTTDTTTLPASPTNGQAVEILFGGAIKSGAVISTLLIQPNSGQSLVQTSTPTSASAGDNLIYIYNTSLSSWYRGN